MRDDAATTTHEAGIVRRFSNRLAGLGKLAFLCAGLVGVVVVPLAMLSTLSAQDEVSPEEGPLERLSQELAESRGDLQRLEERLARVESLEGRLDSLSLELEGREAGGGVSPDDMGERGTRLEELEARLDGYRSLTEIQLSAFAERVGRMASELADAEAAAEQAEAEARLAEDRARRAQASRAASEPQPAAPPRPPFRISGVETRGGEAFLSIATGSGRVNSLRQVRLLGERESQGQWQLVSIAGDTAIFQYQGRRITVPLP